MENLVSHDGGQRNFIVRTKVVLIVIEHNSKLFLCAPLRKELFFYSFLQKFFKEFIICVISQYLAVHNGKFC